MKNPNLRFLDWKPRHPIALTMNTLGDEDMKEELFTSVDIQRHDDNNFSPWTAETENPELYRFDIHLNKESNRRLDLCHTIVLTQADTMTLMVKLATLLSNDPKLSETERLLITEYLVRGGYSHDQNQS